MRRGIALAIAACCSLAHYSAAAQSTPRAPAAAPGSAEGSWSRAGGTAKSGVPRHRVVWGYLGPGIAATTVGIGFAALLGAELVAMRQRTQCVFDFDPVRAIPVESCTRAGPDLTAQVALGAATLGGLALGVPLMARGIVGAETPRPPLQPESPWAHLGPGIASTLIGAACLPALVWASQPAICSNDLRSGPCRSDEQLAVRITLGITAFGHLGVGVPMIVRGAVAAANSHKGSEPPAVTLRPVVGPTQFGFRGTF